MTASGGSATGGPPGEGEPSDETRHIDGFGRAFMEAWRAARGFVDALPAGGGRVVVAGLGGSAAAADLAGAILAQRGWDGVAVVRGHALPSWVTVEDLLIVCSYSGGTREMGLVFSEAQRLRIPAAVVSAGGPLRAAAEAAGAPAFAVRYESAPRHALAWLMAPLLGAAAKRSGDRALWLELADAAGSVHRSFGLERTQMARQAQALASAAIGSTVVLTGAEHMAPVARRWKNQLNENAKHLAFCEELPEAAHNSIEGDTAGALHLVLWSGSYSPRARAVSTGYMATLEAAGARVARVHCSGLPPTAELLSTVLLGDLTSLALAAAKGIDPAPIRRIEAVKESCGGTWADLERAPAV